jgi:hypothetical protein
MVSLGNAWSLNNYKTILKILNLQDWKKGLKLLSSTSQLIIKDKDYDYDLFT